MLRSTPVCQRGWLQRFMQFPARRYKAYWQLPNLAHKKTPLNHKTPEEYGNHWEIRWGQQWFDRMNKRGAYRTWPFVDIRHDPVRRFNDAAASSCRTFSAKAVTANACRPLWDHYAEAGRDYRIVPTAELPALAEFLHVQVGKVWNPSTVKALLTTMAADFASPGAVAECGIEGIRHWATTKGTVPLGFAEHVALLSADVVRQHSLRETRRHQHERGGVLRMENMTEYYALPRLLTKQQQPSWENTFTGKQPRGKFADMNGAQFHPLYMPDRVKKFNFRPA
jgi:hypothetical protein